MTVAVEFTGTRPELNAHLASLDPIPYHLVSTHAKYAPSQQRFLVPIEGFDTSDFFPSLLAMAEIGGALYGIPPNIDLRLRPTMKGSSPMITSAKPLRNRSGPPEPSPSPVIPASVCSRTINREALG